MISFYYFKKKISSFFKIKSYKLFPKGPLIVVSPDIQIDKYVNVKILNINVSIDIDTNVVFQKFCSIVILENAKLIIGKKVFFNNYCSINCLGLITIGNNTLFGESVKLYDHNHKYERSPMVKIIPNEYTIDPIRIGENCWIGSNVTILKGVTIGDNVIVGANCLIHKSIPSNTIVTCGNNVVVQS